MTHFKLPASALLGDSLEAPKDACTAWWDTLWCILIGSFTVTGPCHASLPLSSTPLTLVVPTPFVAWLPRLPSTTLYKLLPESECAVIALSHTCAYSATKSAGVSYNALAACRTLTSLTCCTSSGCQCPHPLHLVGLPMPSLLAV